jgi:transcriptional regulator with XRE-family HTH domain
MLTMEQIKEKMKDRNVSAVARSIGISRQAMYMILHGKMYPSYETLLKLSNYFEGDRK